MPTDKTVKPLPDHECKYCKTVHVGCCSKACVLKKNPNYPLPSVPTESHPRNLARHLAAVRASIVRNGDTTCTVNQDALVHLMNECDILLDKSVDDEQEHPTVDTILRAKRKL